MSVHPSKAPAAPTVANIPRLSLKGTKVSVGYSVAKFLALRTYCRDISPWRMLAVCTLLPLPSLVAAVSPVFFPLYHPRYGPTIGFFLHSTFVGFTTCFGALLHWTSTTGFTKEAFTVGEMVLVSTIGTLLMTGQFYILTTYWTFPIPFMFIVCMPLWNVALMVSLSTVLGRRMKLNPIFGQSAKLYGQNLNLQLTQIIVYPAISVLYVKANNTQRILLTIFFPVVKYGFKRLILRMGKTLGDFRTEVAVSGVEICGSLYQSMIMQAVPSTIAMAIIMGLDVVQGLIAVKYFADRHVDPSIPRAQLFEEAERLLTTTSIVPEANETSKAKAKQSTDAERKRQRIIDRALQMANTAESILLIEYYEVIIPIVNAFYLLIAGQVPSARYNSRLAGFYYDRGLLLSAELSIWTYSLLQGLSCVVMHLVMKYRYGISAFAHLSFVLERHQRPIQGKMIAWLPIILHFTLMHYGSDFSFRFNFQDEMW